MRRGDNQITSLEILSIALGISTFAKEIEGRNLIIWSNNTGAESATRKGVAFVVCCSHAYFRMHSVLALAGSTKQFDQNCLIHAMWKRLAVLNVNVWVERVPTKNNIANDPPRHMCWVSLVCPLRHGCLYPREEYRLSRRLHAKWTRPVFDDIFLKSQTWEALSVLGIM